MIIAVDFDGTLCSNEYPEIGVPNTSLIRALMRWRNMSEENELILWTCRCGKELKDALEWCKFFELEFDAVNENVPSNKAKYENDARKVFADIYLDDRALSIEKFCKIY